jgi:hypothetical protein
MSANTTSQPLSRSSKSFVKFLRGVQVIFSRKQSRLVVARSDHRKRPPNSIGSDNFLNVLAATTDDPARCALLFN